MQLQLVAVAIVTELGRLLLMSILHFVVILCAICNIRDEHGAFTENKYLVVLL